MRQLTSRDAAYLYLGDAHRTATIVSCWVIAAPDGAPSGLGVDQVVDRMNTAAAAADIFAGVLVRLPFDIDLPYWRVDPDFDAADHVVFHRDVPDWPRARERLGDIAARPLDRAKPLWRMDVLVDVAGMPGRAGVATIVAMMFHHAAFDGVTFAHLTNTYLGDEPFPWPYDASTDAIGPDAVPRSRLTARAVVDQPMIWGRLARDAVIACTARARIPDLPELPRQDTEPPTVFGHRVRGVRCTDHAVLSLSDVKALKNRVSGATVNDVMLSVLGGAIAAHLTASGHAPTRSLTALVPVSTRSVDGSGAVNQFVPTVMNMHTDEPRVDLRLAAIAETSAAAKRAAMESALGRGIGVLHRVPALLLRVIGVVARLVERIAPAAGRLPADTVVANVYSPHSIESMFGLEVVGGFGISPLDTPTLAHGIYSRGEHVLVSVTADDAVLTDTPGYIAHITASFAEHVRVLLGDTVH